MINENSMFPINSDILGALLMDEILLLFEGEPLLFTCRGVNGALYIGQSIDDDTIMLAATSSSKVSQLKARNMYIRDIFTANEIIWNMNISGSVAITKEHAVEKMNDILPLGGQYLFSSCLKNNDSMEKLSNIAVTQQQDTMQLRLFGPEGETTMDLGLFSKIISEINVVAKDLLENFVDAIKESSKGCVSNFRLKPVEEGSFIINFVSPTPRNLEGDSGYSLAFQKLVDMLDCRDQSMEAFYGMSFNSIDSVRRMMYVLNRSDYGFEMKYASHKSDTSQYFCTQRMINDYYKMLHLTAEKEERTINYTGMFYSVNLKRRRFWFKCFDDQNEISGNIDKEFEDNIEVGDPRSVEKSTLYTIALLEKTNEYFNGEEVNHYTLLKVEKIKHDELLLI